MARLRPLLPAFLLAAFALSCGTLAGGASWPAAPLGWLLLLLVAPLALAEAEDPLRLGGAGRWLLAAALVAAAGSLLASPTPRAGRVALALVPALLLLPAAIARVWREERERRAGIAAWSAVVALVAGVGIVGAVAGWSARAALPLGHHNLLAAFLLVTAPVAALPLARRGPGRWLAAAAMAATLGALLLSRSWTAWLAAAVVALLASRRLGAARHLVAGVALLALGLAVPRAEAILTGRDSSAAARRGYAAGALEGVAARPLIGHGPGSTPWQLAETLRPLPGVHPPGELVGEAHSLPLQLAFELGLPGAILVVAALALFLVRRRRELGVAADADLLEAGALGLVGGALASVGDAWLQVAALPVALAIAAGAALAGAGPPRALAPRAARALAVALLGCGAAALVRPALGLRAWEAASRAPDRAARAPLLAEASRLDPSFPLYRARWAWDAPAPPQARAATALQAAEDAGGVAPLWLRAGFLALEAGDRVAAQQALGRALSLDPLSGAAPFLIFVASGGERVDCAGRALIADPRLAAATWWRGRAALRERALQAVLGWPGIDPGWREAFVEQARGRPPAEAGEEVDLAIEVDRTPALALSLHLFRRSPLPGEVARIRLDRAAVRRLEVGSAASLPSSAAAAFPRGACAPDPGP